MMKKGQEQRGGRTTKRGKRQKKNCGRGEKVIINKI